MSEAKYTPGPWRVGTPGPNGCHTVGTQNGLMTAIVTHSINHPEQCERAIADAHLIAAAPELLEALDGLMELERRGRLMPIGREWDAARAAIAKATGADK